ncbi:MHS family MFS transporter [Arthrobacter sp. BHU FT2]|nr:MHS family MFS transporter [Arthrobacter sp. BHU FT2]
MKIDDLPNDAVTERRGSHRPDAVVEPDTLQHETHATKHPRKAAIAAWIGSALEYYDFFIYGVVATLVFPAIFFPAGNAAAATIASLATFGVGYAARPLGSFLMGHVGDRLGRKKVLVGTLLLMGVSTFLVGCLPTYDQIGLWAPSLLVFLRILQGISAAGEQAGANSMSFEHAPFGRRGYYTSWTLSGSQAGQVLAPAAVLPLAALLSEEQLLSWGWRVPFWISALMIVVGFIVRRTLEESPAFGEEAEADRVPSAPLGVLFREYKKPLFQVIFAALISSVGSTFATFGLSYATSKTYGIGLSPTMMLWVAILANIVATLIIPVFATISDRIGRKPVFMTGTIGCAVSVVVFLWSISTGDSTLVMITGIALGGIVYSLTNAVWPVTYAERFPTKVRLSGMAVGTQIGFAIGGFAPLAAAALAGLGNTPTWVLPAAYAATMCIVSTIAIATMKDNYKVQINDIGVSKEKEEAKVA